MSKLIVAYDFSNTKVRTKFSKFLSQYGRRLQYSVFEIQNSERILKNILTEVENVYKPLFSKADSILIFEQKHIKIHRFGCASDEEKELVFL